MKVKKKATRLLAITLLICISVLNTIYASPLTEVVGKYQYYSAEKQWYKDTNQKWFCLVENGERLANTWYQDKDGKWYYLSSNGSMLANTWFQDKNGKWYYLSSSGSMLANTWYKSKNEKWYYLGNNGAMLTGSVTPDGYTLNSDGSWNTSIAKKTKTTKLGSFSGGSSGGGGSSHSSDNEKEQSEDSNFNINNLETNNSDTNIEENETTPPKTTHPETTPSEATQEKKYYEYSLIYKDIETKTILHEVVGKMERSSVVEIEHMDIDGYHICDNQANSVKLNSDKKKVIIYYEKDIVASSSQAQEENKIIKWEIRFVDSDTHQINLSDNRSGEIQKGGSLHINYLNKISKENEIWEAIKEPPIDIVVNGPGDEIYYIEYVKTGEITSDDPEKDQKELLKKYIDIAKECDSNVTGENTNKIPDNRFYVTNEKTNNNRIRSLVSQVDGTEEFSFYIIGKNYEPNGSIISNSYDNVEYSNLLEETIQISGVTYYVTRLTVEKKYDSATCEHNWILVNEQIATTQSKGVKTYKCSKCGEIKTIYTPAIGQTQHWNKGDLIDKEIAGKTYIFQCIDQEYFAGSETNEQMALFLCNSVIPANIGSKYSYESNLDDGYDYVFEPGPIVKFGTSNDYKYSEIRKWLDNVSKTTDVTTIDIGVDYAYIGSTKSGEYEESEEGLRPYYIGNQKLTGKMFVLSVAEALKYKDYLWKFNGSDYDNAESQCGTFCKAYWLRNPMGMSNGYNETKQVYVVDLVNGNIHPQSIKKENESEDQETNVTCTVGVRPAMVLPQY